MVFLPPNYEDSKPKAGGGYLKFEKGETRFRFLTSPIVGYLAWKDRKPYRIRLDESFTERFGFTPPSEGQERSKLFWAATVWNEKEKRVQILEIALATVQEPIEALAKDADWGDPLNYDIKVTKTGEGKETKYAVNPVPAKELSAEAKEAFAESNINLDALFSGGNPFQKSEESAGATPATEEDLPF